MKRIDLSGILFLSFCVPFVSAPLDVSISAGRFHQRVTVERSALCHLDEDLPSSIAALGLKVDGPDQFEAERALIATAQKSVECRRTVINALIAAMAQSPADVAAERRKYILFQNGGRILAKLKATEALEVLIANLGLTDGLSISIGHYPSVGALIEIGEAAIPQLEAVLNIDSQPYRRKFAAFCIASIGGDKAKRSLAKALPDEQDACVNRLLRTSLELFKNPDHPNHVAPGDARLLEPLYCRTD